MKITHIIIHCSDSEFGNAAMIREWHIARGFKDIGYHKVILNGHLEKGVFVKYDDGLEEKGRPLDDDHEIKGLEIGAHCLGYNTCSVGICLIGKDTFTPRQMASLNTLVCELILKHDIPIENVLGHYETISGIKEGKTCPNFSVRDFRLEIARDLG